MSKSPNPSTSRPPDANEVALRALRTRDLSVAELEQRLVERGVGEHDAATAVAALVRTGLVDDARLAERRAAALADRSAGDSLIRHRLGALGIDRDLIEDAIAALALEQERALRIVERRGSGPRTARYLAGKGFSEECVRNVVARDRSGELG
jgi:regulatory protein